MRVWSWIFLPRCWSMISRKCLRSRDETSASNGCSGRDMVTQYRGVAPWPLSMQAKHLTHLIYEKKVLILMNSITNWQLGFYAAHGLVYTNHLVKQTNNHQTIKPSGDWWSSHSSLSRTNPHWRNPLDQKEGLPFGMFSSMSPTHLWNNLRMASIVWSLCWIFVLPFFEWLDQPKMCFASKINTRWYW